MALQSVIFAQPAKTLHLDRTVLYENSTNL